MTRRGLASRRAILISAIIWIATTLWNPTYTLAQRLHNTTVLHNFTGEYCSSTDGAHPTGDLTLSGNTLYGMTPRGGGCTDYGSLGTMFKINKDGTGYQLLHIFNGFEAAGFGGAHGSPTLSPDGTTLYGMTPGSIFKINTDGTGFKTLYSFGAFDGDGNVPEGSLTISEDGRTLYGMTTLGGGFEQDNTTYGLDYGTIFKINTDGTGYQILHSFAGNTAGDGEHPHGTLVLSGSTLYGMTSGADWIPDWGTVWCGSGGTECGTIFKINTDGTGYEILHNFTGQTGDTAYPYGSLTLSGSVLYGMASGTTGAGASDFCGDIFEINTDGTGFTLLHSFKTDYSEGIRPYGSLTLSADGSTLYGMTSAGGNQNQDDEYPVTGDGTIFQINTDGTGFQVLHNFQSTTDGQQPMGSLALSGPVLYGMTEYGGAGIAGTVFSLNLNSVNGACGSSNGAALTSAPTSNLCSAGTPTAVTGSGPWDWTCQGVNSGANASCSADVLIWPNATDCGNGWRWLSWFGYFNMNSYPWIYHRTLGWLYAYGTSTDSIWFYDPQWNGMGGWWWTSSSVFPWIYSAYYGIWFYYAAKDSTPGARWFCNSGLGCGLY